MKKDKEYFKWLNDRKYFAKKIYMDGLVVILAVKGGDPYLICTGGHKSHSTDHTFRSFKEKGGGKAICVKSINDLEFHLNTGEQ